ncbi:MAG: DUF6089 family protein [Chitinophagales bacterium]
MKIYPICLLFSMGKLSAQHEIGVSIGTSHLLGDFGGGAGTGTIFIKDIDLAATRPAFGVFYRYNFAKFLGIRAQLLYGRLYGNDKYSENQSRNIRQLQSTSPVFDINAQFEFNFIPLRLCDYGMRFSPYIAGGVGIAKTSPKLSSNNGGIPDTELQYIKAESKNTAIVFPISIGLKLKTKKKILLGLEVSHRIVLEDDLDNYIRQENDQYFFTTFNVSYIFCKKGRVNSFYQCPKF